MNEVILLGSLPTENCKIRLLEHGKLWTVNTGFRPFVAVRYEEGGPFVLVNELPGPHHYNNNKRRK